MTLNKHLLIDLALILALALLAVVGYKLSPLLLPKSDLTLTPEPGCDLHRSACAARLPDGGHIEFSITPRPIPMVQPFQIDVTASGTDIRKVDVDFAGATMNMGYNRPALAQSGPGHFTGQANLPVCVTGRMTWKATVMLETDRQRIAVPILFDSHPD
jgi:hypothetical protein